nr:hypothetical protein [Tanacetum cinerariifolium]
MTTSKLELIVKEFGISIDLRPRIPLEGMTMDRLSEVAIDVRALAEHIIDLRLVHPTLLYTIGLANVWEFSCFRPIFKDTRGNVITMSGYLYFPFTANVVISTGDAIPAQDKIVQHTTVEVAGEKVLPAKEKKKIQAAKTATKKKSSKKITKAGNFHQSISDSKEDKDDELLHHPHQRTDLQTGPVANNEVKEKTLDMESFATPGEEALHINLEEPFTDESNANDVSRLANNRRSSHGRSGGALLSEPREILREIMDMCSYRVPYPEHPSSDLIDMCSYQGALPGTPEQWVIVT